MQLPQSMAPHEQQTLRLETFLDTVLRKSLRDVLLQRDHLFNMAASCTHLRQLLKSARTLTLEDPNSVSAVNASIASKSSSTAAESTRSASPSSSASTASSRLEAMDVLVDIGNHFFMQARVADPSIIHINIGCGVVVPMNHTEAERFLMKREKSFTEMAQMKTKEALKVKFRIRLVMEAISRLQGPALQRGGQGVGGNAAAF